MTEVKLLSIKIKPEHAYFFENDGATFDSNSNKVTVAPSNNVRKMSKKDRKAAEKEQKKQQKKELEQRKKEMKKSAKMKNSQKTEIQDSDMKTDESVKTNGEVNLPQFTNPVFQDEILGKDEDVNVKENVPPTSSLPEPTRSQIAQPGSSGIVTGVEEQPVTRENFNPVQEAPRELLMNFKPKPEVTEIEQGQHVEVEISEVTEDMSGSNGMGSESEITMAIVQEVESGLDLDSFFIEVYGETGVKSSQEKRKSVRFEEPRNSEQDTDSKAEDNDGKTTKNDNEDNEDGLAEASEQCEKPQSDEHIDKELINNVESCEMDLDELFELCDKEDRKTSEAQLEVENDANTSEVGNHRIEIASDDITPNGKPSKQKEETGSKTEKRKKGGLLKCCFS